MRIKLVYMPAKPTTQFKTFCAPIVNLQDTTVTYPYIGANSWIASLRTVPDGNIHPHHQYVQLKLTFKDGGVTDFDDTFKRVKESLLQAIDVARESGRGDLIDLSTVHLDQLPEYSETNNTNIPFPLHRPTPISPANVPHTPQDDSALDDNQHPLSAPNAQDEPFQPPNEPPPGYEEAQSSAVANSLEQHVQQSG